MALFKVVVEAYVASPELDQASLSRLAFSTDELGEKEVAAISADDIDAATIRLAVGGSSLASALQLVAASRSRAPPSIAISRRPAGSVFKHARRLRLVPRTFVAPTRGIERAATLTVARTKNGDPVTAGLSAAAIAELRRLPKTGADELVFGNRRGKPFTYTPLWKAIAKEARLAGRVFHELRHGHGYRLAQAGVSQQLIMQSMGHRTLAASARYAHACISDKKAVIERVFG
jgi:hypothetical protein